jgi:cobalt/nickel transport protein
MMDNNKFLAIGLIIVILIGVTAVFMASGDPDGLESTALVVQGEKTLTGPSPEEGDAEAIGSGTFSYEAPLPDYSVVGAEKPGELFALIIGIVSTFLIVGGASYIITSKGSKP